MKVNKNKLAGFISLAISIAFFLGAFWLFLHRQYAVDQFAVWQYTPSAEIVSVAQQAHFSEAGQFYFYATHPTIDGTSNFNVECAKQETGSAVLGCYVHNNIYIYDITDSRLHGIKAVTAAHETLHAIYARLSDDKRQHINDLLEAQYAKLNDAKLTERMEYYARTEPGQRDNELHSIIATEFSQLSPELEAYYGQYFTDRQAVVALHASYSQQFEKRIEQRKKIGKQLDQLSSQIKSLSDEYNQGVKQLNQDIAHFNARAQAGDFYSQSQFSAERNILVDRNNELADMRQAINHKIDRYETLRKQYNQLVDESNSLQKSIDSSLAPPPKV